MSEKNKRILQVGLAIGLVGLIAAVYTWYIWAKPEITKQKKEQESKSAQIATINRQLMQIQNQADLQKTIQQKKAFLEQASRRLPATPNAEGFLASLSDMLQRSSVKVRSVNGEAIQPRSNYTEIPWRVSAMAQYVELGVFFNLVEENPQRLMRVKSFTISNDEELPGYHPVDIQIGTFMFNK